MRRTSFHPGARRPLANPAAGARRRMKAFTLVELLVAMFITAILFAMGYGAINTALKDRTTLRQHQDRLTAVQKAVRVMVQDFVQLEPRPVRDPMGDGWQPALRARQTGAQLADQDGQLLVQFTRGGWANPAGIQRPTLERVAYVLQDGTLERLHWPVLDATQQTQPIRRDLLTHVKSVTLRYMDAAHQWTDEWPPQLNTAATGTALSMRPIAVEVTLDLDDWGRIVRVIEVAG